MQEHLKKKSLEKTRINLDIAYQNNNKLWSDQLNIKSTRYKFISGDILSIFHNYKKKINVLDVGCGYGAFPNYLSKFKNISAYGIDVSKYAIDHGKKKYKFRNIYQGDINSMNFHFNSKFDVLTFIGVFWFMYGDFKNCFKNIKKISKKNVKIYFQTYNPKNNTLKYGIGNYSDLYNFLNNFFIVEEFFSLERKTKTKKNILSINNECIIKCRLR